MNKFKNINDKKQTLKCKMSLNDSKIEIYTISRDFSLIYEFPKIDIESKIWRVFIGFNNDYESTFPNILKFY